jgi:hypothetical protein
VLPSDEMPVRSIPRRARTAAVVAALAVALAACSETPCQVPLQACGDTCHDLRSDLAHCGACGAACAAGAACVGGACTTGGASEACAVRSGGAFVTIAACGETVKVWSTSTAFVSRAEELLLGAMTGPAMPRLELRAGADCDAQWTWHGEPSTATFVGSPDLLCSACPSGIEAARDYWLLDVGVWCPDPSVQEARVVAVDRR